MVVLGSPILCAVIWVIRYTGQWFYFYVWFFLCVTSIFLMTIYPVYIAPLFNKVRIIKFSMLSNILFLFYNACSILS
jgi:hypothetical protein